MNFICEGDKYELMGPNSDVISLSVSLEDIPKEINTQGETLYLPNPFHLSLVYIGKIVEKYNVSIPDFANKIIDDFCGFVEANPIEIVRYTNEFRFVDRGDSKKTVVAMCEVSNLNKFFDFINQKYKLNIKYPTPHVTLYNTLAGQPGIALSDEDDIKSITCPIKNPIGFDL